jgi:dTDP-4-dehydrorhamnose 3,5-epimerase
VQVDALPIDGAWVFTPRQFADERGVFLEWYKAAVLAPAVGHPLALAQGNSSISRRGVLRGVHFADVPPGQAKYVCCPVGRVLDAVVDIRVGSPTFGRVETVVLDDVDRRAVYLTEGLGHAFLALSDDAVVTYLVSTPYTPERGHELHPLDPELGIPWPGDVQPRLSPKDAAAPTLAAARETGLLPSYDACRAVYDTLRTGSGQ